MVTNVIRAAALATAGLVVAVATSATAQADNSRLNNGVVANVYTIQHQAGCTGEIKKNPALTEADVRAYCEANLTGYKRPKVVVFTDALPKTPVGKILRRELRGT